MIEDEERKAIARQARIDALRWADEQIITIEKKMVRNGQCAEARALVSVRLELQYAEARRKGETS